MPVIRDDDEERIERIETPLQKVQDELSALREERRVVTEQIHQNAKQALKRAGDQQAANTCVRSEAAVHRRTTKTLLTRKKR